MSIIIYISVSLRNCEPIDILRSERKWSGDRKVSRPRCRAEELVLWGISPNQPPRDQQQVQGDGKLVRCHGWSCRSPWKTVIRRNARLGRKHSWLKLLDPCIGAAVLGMMRSGCTEPKESQAQGIVHTCAHLNTLQILLRWTTT